MSSAGIVSFRICHNSARLLAGGTINNFMDASSSSQSRGQDGIFCPAPVTATLPHPAIKEKVRRHPN